MDDKRETIEVFSDLTVKIGSRTLLAKGTLEVRRGTVTVLMGPSGAGKSMLSDLVFGTEVRGARIESGTVARTARERGALVFQEGGGLPHLSVLENLAVTGTQGARCEEIARTFRLAPHTLGSAMSGGERRRLAVARAVLTKRTLLWLDEPDAGLDVERIDELGRTLRKAADGDDGLAIVVITHNTRLVAATRAERVLVLGHDAKLAEIDAGGGAGGAEALETQLRNRLAEQGGDAAHAEGARAGEEGVLANAARWLTQIPDAVCGVPAMVRERAARRTLGQALALSAVRGVLYYPFIGAIFGGVFILVFVFAVPFLAPEKVIAEFGADIVVRFAPPIAAILIAACAGSTIAAWVGQMTALRQLDALAVLGVDVGRRVLAPIWWGLSVGAVINTVTFAAGITAVMAAYVATQGGAEAASAFWTGFGAGGGKGNGIQAVGAALVKTLGYAALLAAVSIGSASAALRSQRAVAAAITRGIVWSSLVVMSAELIVLAFNYAELNR